MKRTELQRRAPLRRALQLKRSAAIKRKSALTKNIQPKKPKTENEILDNLVRQIVLVRAKFKCEWCGRGVEPGRGRALQAAHLYPKGAHPALRHEINNVICLCWRCHFERWHKSPIEAWEWVRQKYGQPLIDALRLLSQTRKKVDKKALRIFLEQMLAAMTAESRKF